jgi:PAS domain S-box-containing protein
MQERPESTHLPLQFQAVLDAAPDAMLVTDKDGRIALVNARAERLLGYTTRELIGEPIERLVHPLHRNEYLAGSAGAQGPAGFGVELVARRKDGSGMAVEIELSPIETDHGTFAITALRDVSARKRVAAKFRGLIEAVPGAMAIADVEGRIVLVNAQVERLFGYERDELLGQTVEALIPERLRQAHPEHRRAYFENPSTREMGERGALFGRRKDGSEFPAAISLSPLDTEDGRLAIIVIADVTAERRAEQERARLHARVKELEGQKARFFAYVSDELRAPLVEILGSLDEALRRVESDETRNTLEGVGRNARSALGQVEDLLAAAKLGTSDGDIDYACVDLTELVRRLTCSLTGVASERDISLQFESPVALEAESVVRCTRPGSASASRSPTAVRVWLRNIERRCSSVPGDPKARRSPSLWA